MKLISWNVNGIRAAMDKGLRDFVSADQPDVLCLQETKAEPSQVDTEWADELGYYQIWNSAEKKGYSGTSIWSKDRPANEALGIGISQHDKEGRVVTATFQDFHLVNVYTPNAKRGLVRLEYRQQWDADFLDYVKNLESSKPVILCGDLNCAHTEIDLANPKSNKKNAGFSEEERAGLDNIVKAGFVDSFRHFEPGPEHYSWWTYRNNARERNIGWRLDYFFVSSNLIASAASASIRTDVFGSDHCPVELILS